MRFFNLTIVFVVMSFLNACHTENRNLGEVTFALGKSKTTTTQGSASISTEVDRAVQINGAGDLVMECVTSSSKKCFYRAWIVTSVIEEAHIKNIQQEEIIFKLSVGEKRPFKSVKTGSAWCQGIDSIPDANNCTRTKF